MESSGLTQHNSGCETRVFGVYLPLSAGGAVFLKTNTRSSHSLAMLKGWTLG
ncbi:hypothetical protein E2C01_078265 [Portunus trituberculatus]|uniref:Uncharacterized protein n=1 Tax=Portunus trituberculatus TaxID=210409 RepID=A0A5B7IM68_PORTR|nr:hypothetical protein [Portunus trituberculatus]